MNNQQLSGFLNEETYKDLFDNAHDLIHLVDMGGNLMYVNRAWEELLGYTAVEIKGRPIYSFVDGPDLKQFTEYREEIISRDNNKRDEIRVTFVSKSGEKIVTEGFISVKFKDHQPIYTRGIFRDITEKVRNEQQLLVYTGQLKEKEENLRKMLQHAPDAVIVIDHESRVRFWNEKAEMIFGWSASEVQDQELYEFIIPPQHREAHSNGMKRYLATGETHVLNTTVEITALNKNREEIFISLTISTTHQYGDIAFIAFIRDITAQKLADSELKLKRKELEATNAELEQFAYAASHDMQEPLRKIQTYSSFLIEHEKGNLTEKGESYLMRINQSTERMKGIIDALLNYSHQSQSNDLFAPVDLNKVIKNAITDLELLIEQKQAKIITSPLPDVHGIAVQMDQLFYNLIHNALKFSQEGIDTIVRINSSEPNEDEIIRRQLDPTLKYTMITVSDNGIGFDTAYSEKIFVLFQRLNSRYAYEGTGIGLSLCRKIITNHNGAIWVDSEAGQGSCFYLLLPLAGR